MNEKEFGKLIDKKKYQVFLCGTTANTVTRFFIHSYFVTNEKGKVNRWEIGMKKNMCKTSWGYLHLNLLKPWEGFEKAFFKRGGPRFGVKVLAQIEGKEARKMIFFLKKSPKTYKYNYYYWAYPGPNSNTFVQWVIDHFPKSRFRLPWCAIGKNYSYK